MDKSTLIVAPLIVAIAVEVTFGVILVNLKSSLFKASIVTLSKTFGFKVYLLLSLVTYIPLNVG